MSVRTFRSENELVRALAVSILACAEKGAAFLVDGGV